MRFRVLTWAVMLVLLGAPGVSFAHCDSLAGPVVKDAQKALAAGDVTPVLKWVRPADEAEVRAAFAKARNVRGGGSDAGELADHYFFETLVRLHRAGEGAPFTGLKPADAIEPDIAAADRALESGDVERLSAEQGHRLEQAIRNHHAAARLARAHADESVELGRKYVAAYVEYVHLVERAAALASGEAPEAHEH